MVKSFLESHGAECQVLGAGMIATAVRCCCKTLIASAVGKGVGLPTNGHQDDRKT